MILNLKTLILKVNKILATIADKKSAFQVILKLTAKPEDIAAIKDRMKLVGDLIRFEIYNPQVLAS